jgi:hypothetical protein
VRRTQHIYPINTYIPFAKSRNEMLTSPHVPTCWT